MLTDNCKKILKYLLKQDSDKRMGQWSLYEVTQACGVADNEALPACYHLASLGLLFVEKNPINVGYTIYRIQLTEKGAHLKQQKREDTWEYIKNNWIAIVALIVAILAYFKP